MPRRGTMNDVPYDKHIEIVRRLDEKFQTERDRRYTEVNIEREKALKIKEEADKNALELDRQIRDYKEQKHNDLIQQNQDERGTYATQSDLKAVNEKIEALIKPLSTYVTTQQGQTKGSEITMGKLYACIAGLGGIVVLANYLFK
jgi:hypothetical protein